jgi:hypothetical protein
MNPVNLDTGQAIGERDRRLAFLQVSVRLFEFPFAGKNMNSRTA